MVCQKYKKSNGSRAEIDWDLKFNECLFIYIKKLQLIIDQLQLILLFIRFIEYNRY